jgi:hypothetical protein
MALPDVSVTVGVPVVLTAADGTTAGRNDCC